MAIDSELGEEFAVVALVGELVPADPVEPSLLQATVLHKREASPEQTEPPPDGAGLVQVRVCVPPPHVAEHDPKALHPPSIGQA